MRKGWRHGSGDTGDAAPGGGASAASKWNLVNIKENAKIEFVAVSLALERDPLPLLIHPLPIADGWMISEDDDVSTSNAGGPFLDIYHLFGGEMGERGFATETV